MQLFKNKKKYPNTKIKHHKLNCWLEREDFPWLYQEINVTSESSLRHFLMFPWGERGCLLPPSQFISGSICPDTGTKPCSSVNYTRGQETDTCAAECVGVQSRGGGKEERLGGGKHSMCLTAVLSTYLFFLHINFIIFSILNIWTFPKLRQTSSFLLQLV